MWEDPSHCGQYHLWAGGPRWCKSKLSKSWRAVSKENSSMVSAWVPTSRFLSWLPSGMEWAGIYIFPSQDAWIIVFHHSNRSPKIHILLKIQVGYFPKKSIFLYLRILNNLKGVQVINCGFSSSPLDTGLQRFKLPLTWKHPPWWLDFISATGRKQSIVLTIYDACELPQ